MYFLELLISKRPPNLKNTGPLYLRPLDKPHEDVWYSSQPVGVNTIDTYMKKIAKLGNVDFTNKKFTTHSVRRQLSVSCKRQGFLNDKIAAITGHRN